jgi:hypothetical protein
MLLKKNLPAKKKRIFLSASIKFKFKILERIVPYLFDINFHSDIIQPDLDPPDGSVDRGCPAGLSEYTTCPSSVLPREQRDEFLLCTSAVLGSLQVKKTIARFVSKLRKK